MLCFYKSLPWLVIETYGSKLSNITISFYLNIVCKYVLCDMGLKVYFLEKNNFLDSMRNISGIKHKRTPFF